MDWYYRNIFSSWLYGDPVRLGYKGFGEIAIALGFGPVMVMGAHYVLTASIHENVVSN